MLQGASKFFPSGVDLTRCSHANRRLQRDINFLLKTYREMAEKFYAQYERSLLDEITKQRRVKEQVELAIGQYDKDLKDLKDEDVIKAIKTAKDLLTEDGKAADAEYQKLIKSFPTLLQNALEATPPGGRVELEVRADAACGWEILVRDTGPGVAEGVRGRLFEPCQSTKPGGNGLGLALSRQLAQRAGGQIELVSGAGPGACFRLSLAAAV